MGYAWNGVCYQDAIAASVAFSKDIPSIDGTGINYLTAPVTVTQTGAITWSISNRPLTNTIDVVRTGITRLQPCDAGLDQWPMQSTFFYAALFFAAFLGFRTGFRP